MKDRRQWVAIELDFCDHPKILKVGALGGWAHLRSIIYAARHRTDGFIPDEAVWLILHDDPDMDEASDSKQTPSKNGFELSMVEAGLWHRVANGYMIHDYLEHQANAETMREKRARAGRLGGLARAQKAASTSKQTKLDVDVEKEEEQTPNPNPAVDVAANGHADHDLIESVLAGKTELLKDVPM